MRRPGSEPAPFLSSRGMLTEILTYKHIRQFLTHPLPKRRLSVETSQTPIRTRQHLRTFVQKDVYLRVQYLPLLRSHLDQNSSLVSCRKAKTSRLRWPWLMTATARPNAVRWLTDLQVGRLPDMAALRQRFAPIRAALGRVNDNPMTCVAAVDLRVLRSPARLWPSEMSPIAYIGTELVTCPGPKCVNYCPIFVTRLSSKMRRSKRHFARCSSSRRRH